MQPLIGVAVPLPSFALKLTVPVGVMPEVGVTFAVNVSWVLTGTEALDVFTTTAGVAAVTA